MKRFLLVLLSLVSVLGVVAPVTSNARVIIEVGDRPYYTHGAFYYENGRRLFWIPGHWNRRHVWVHGHYGPR
jgi:hypothetical protein